MAQGSSAFEYPLHPLVVLGCALCDIVLLAKLGCNKHPYLHLTVAMQFTAAIQLNASLYVANWTPPGAHKSTTAAA